MLKKEIYNSVMDSFDKSFSWLGTQFGSMFLESVASYNIQTFSDAPFRIRKHIMLCWQHGLYKTSLLMAGYKMLGREHCTTMSDISNAALRGTVEAQQFVSPYTLKRPFAICTEFGQVSAGGDKSELVQKLLNVLEEGVVEVSLGKISYLSTENKKKISEDWGLYFIDENTFSYRTNWVLMAATYNNKFLVDNALLSRFNVMYPKKKIDNSLIKHVVNSGGFKPDDDTIYAFRDEILKPSKLDTNIRLPDEVYDGPLLNPRDCGNLLSTILCRSWWNVKTSKDDILQMADEMRRNSEEVWTSAEDRVFKSIEFVSKTAQEIAKETDISAKHVYTCLKKIGAYGVVAYDDDGNSIRKWRM